MAYKDAKRFTATQFTILWNGKKLGNPYISPPRPEYKDGIKRPLVYTHSK